VAQRTKSDRLRVSAAFLHGKEPGRINYNAPSEKSTTHVEGSTQIPRTEGNSRPRHTGAAEAAGHWRLEPTVYELSTFRLKDFSFTSVTVESAFILCGGITPRRLGDGGSRHLSRPRGRKHVPRRNEPSRTDSGSLRPPDTRRNRAGSTSTHQPRKVLRTAREATNYRAPKEIVVRTTREPRRRPGIGFWDTWSTRYAPFV
jgi:hypothetical protein